MVFGAITGNTNLKNEVFCLTEERDFLRSKLLESVSEMTALKEELRAQKRQVDRLRRQLMEGGGGGSLVLPLTPKTSPSLEKDVEDETTSSTSSEEVSSTAHASQEETENENDDEDADSAKDIRQSAEKLLQWASYQSSMRTTTAPPTPDHSSAASASDLVVRHPIQSITLSSHNDILARQDDDAASEHSDWED